MGRLISAVVVVACAAFALIAWWRMGQPVNVPDAPSPHAACVSYAPFQGSETPFDRNFRVPGARVDRDMALLSTFTDCVRIYASSNGLDQVPAAAKKYGMTVLQGIWIGRNDTDNDAEIKRAIGLAHQFPKTISALIVGNEALLRREITASRLATLIRSVKTQVAQPVTYADVWEFWEQNPSLADAVDFITIHLLPYWEDNPVSVDKAIAHVASTYAHMKQIFPNKRLLIGEVGWPSAGRQRQGAEATLVNETRFVRGIVAAADKFGWSYNLIESFDQPWKRNLEGTVGGAWGLFGHDRQPKVSLHGPVIEIPQWKVWLIGDVVGGILITLAALGWGRLIRMPRLDPWGWLITCASALASSGALTFYAFYLSRAARSPWEWAIYLVVWGLMLMSSVVISRVLAMPGPCPTSILLGWLRRLALIAATITVLGHAAAARYRDFPTSMLAIAVVGFVLLRLRQTTDPLPRKPEDSLLATLVLACSIDVVFDEGWLNGDALVWAASLGLLALSILPLDILWDRKARLRAFGRGLP